MEDVATAIADRILSGRSPLTGAIDIPIAGCSMVPVLMAGETLRIEPVAADVLRTGDVVVFARDTAMIAHRIIGRSGKILLTRGDARLAPDAPVALRQVLGRAAKAIPIAPRSLLRWIVATVIDQMCLLALRLHPTLARKAAHFVTRIERSSSAGQLIAFATRRRTTSR